MTTVNNKTRGPLRVPLPGGKILHLGPGKSGQISSKDAEHPGIKKLVDAASIELVDDDAHQAEGGGGGTGHASTRGHTRGSGSRRSGDR